jgi:hypothetical protein
MIQKIMMILTALFIFVISTIYTNAQQLETENNRPTVHLIGSSHLHTQWQRTILTNDSDGYALAIE